MAYSIIRHCTLFIFVQAYIHVFVCIKRNYTYHIYLNTFSMEYALHDNNHRISENFFHILHLVKMFAKMINTIQEDKNRLCCSFSLAGRPTPGVVLWSGDTGIKLGTKAVNKSDNKSTCLEIEEPFIAKLKFCTIWARAYVVLVLVIKEPLFVHS